MSVDREENKRRQSYLRTRGYNVKVDGSWGPSQQKMWDKETLVDKNYEVSPWGMASSLIDKVTGDTKRRIDPIGHIQASEDTSRLDYEKPDFAQRNRDYLHPIWGAGERWKASMHNGTNPIVGLKNTFVPAALAAATATGITEAPALLSRIPGAIRTGVQWVSSHPSSLTTLAKYHLGNLASPFIKGAIGGEVVNATTRAFNDGKDWGQTVAPYLGVSEELADWTNPGYLLGGKKLGIRDSMRKKARMKVLDANHEAKMEHFNTIDDELTAQRDKVQNELWSLPYDYSYVDGIRKLKWDRQELRLPERVSDASSRAALKRENRNASRILTSDETPKVGINQLTVTYTDPTNQALSGEPVSLSFTDELGNTSTSKLFPFSRKSTTPSNYHAYISFDQNGQPYPQAQVSIESGARRGVTYSGYTPEVQQSIGQYVDRLNTAMQGEGTVAGSLMHFKNGTFPASEIDGRLSGPGDTEIYSTAARVDRLKNLLQFRSTSTNPVGGAKGTSPFTFRGNSNHAGVDTEINLIQADENGNATGTVAHQIYRALFPEQYAKMSSSPLWEGVTSPTMERSLPISAEDLYQLVRKEGNMMKHLTTDMFGANSFTNPNGHKHSLRQIPAIFNPNNTERIREAINTTYSKHLEGYVEPSKYYSSIKFNDIKSNIEFLKQAYLMSDEEAQHFAANPDIMRNAFNHYINQQTTGIRLIPSEVASAKTPSGKPKFDLDIEAFTGNGAFGGGTGWGQGLNLMANNPEGGWTIGPTSLIAMSQRPITFKPETIKTPLDAITQLKRIVSKKTSVPELYAPNLHVSSISSEQPMKYDHAKMDFIRQWAVDNDIPMLLSGTSGDHYIGGLAKPHAKGLFVSRSRFQAPEFGSLFRDIDNQTTNSRVITYENSSEEFKQAVRDRYTHMLSLLNKDFSGWKDIPVKERPGFIKRIRADFQENEVQPNVPSLPIKVHGKFRTSWSDRNVINVESSRSDMVRISAMLDKAKQDLKYWKEGSPEYQATLDKINQYSEELRNASQHTTQAMKDYKQGFRDYYDKVKEYKQRIKDIQQERQQTYLTRQQKKSELEQLEQSISANRAQKTSHDKLYRSANRRNHGTSDLRDEAFQYGLFGVFPGVFSFANWNMNKTNKEDLKIPSRRARYKENRKTK